MRSKLTAIAFLSSALFLLACGGGSDANAVNGEGELPEGINTSPVETGSNATPGIPSDTNSNNVPTGTVPTPGIPANGNAANSLPKGATPTPGIPDEETLRRQLERRDIDANVVNQAPPADANYKRKDPLGRPRKAGGN